MTAYERLMHSTIRISILDEQKAEVGSATGFMFAFCEKTTQEETRAKICIVSNKHVLGVGGLFRFAFTKKNKQGNPTYGDYEFIDVFVDNDFVIPHPDPSIDLTILPIDALLRQLEAEIGHSPFYTCLRFSDIPKPMQWECMDAVEDIIMIGYPNGIWDKRNNLPVFRRGITASHPIHNFNGKPEFMMDIACFPGSSGSPVILIKSGPLDPNMKDDFVIGAPWPYLVGILSSGPHYYQEGKVVEIPTKQSVAITKQMINLGTAIKSSELLAFENVLRR